MNNNIFIGMSEDAIRARVVQTAAKWIGVREGTDAHRQIVDIYNSQPQLPRGYRLQYDDPWCGGFVSVPGIELGITDVILPEVGCDAMIERYKKAGRWMEDDAYVPKPADIVMFDWDAEKGECTGSPDHVGMVYSVSGKNIWVVDGNNDNQVKCWDICVEYIKIRGYCLPDYASLVQPFTDVPRDAWYAKDIAEAAALGIVKGVGNGLFEPDRPMTRAEGTSIAMRAIRYLTAKK